MAGDVDKNFGHTGQMLAGVQHAQNPPRTSDQNSSSDAVVFAIMALLLYFLPALVASQRRHKNRAAIGIMNLFLGWTGLGWIGALIWAATANTEGRKQ